MAVSNHDRVTRALDLLKTGLGPFVEREIKQAIKQSGFDTSVLQRDNDRLKLDRAISEWDAAALLRTMWESWNTIFRNTLGHEERSLVSELRSIRDKWAHQQTFSFDDTYRALDSTVRLLTAISAEAEASEVERSKEELMRLRYEEQSRNLRRRIQTTLVEPGTTHNLPAWRDVITPHDDVAKGSYQKAEYAADLWRVHKGGATQEYQDPEQFFRRTFLTKSLTGLLANALLRLNGLGGDPVVQLQTNFGGGKTHSMLALYHLASGTALKSLAGIDDVMAKSEIDELPTGIRRAVLVGNKISPSTPVKKDDGTVVHTLWGELAYQLGGREAYDVIAADDEHATSPGDALRELLNRYGPCLILIDEWVAYARQLHEDSDLGGGSFETQFTFAQTLTEAATSVGNALLVVSLPASDSDIETGGEFGQRALERLRNALGRIDSNWRPANQDESFEIVRRRLFDQIPTELYPKRDAVARAFASFYQSEPSQFPTLAREPRYADAIKEAYPIHPEVFARLYGEWSTLAHFQRTRGVLRLMASVIHTLWESGDRNPLIMPCHLPLDNEPVRTELTNYLPESWNPVIDRDVDSERSTAHQVDSEVTSLGRLQASLRVMRTLFLDTAPVQNQATRGVDAKEIKLGSVMPGEGAGFVDDALRRLAQRSTYLNEDHGKYWLDVQPTVNQLANERADQIVQDDDRLSTELSSRMKDITRRNPDQIGIHLFPNDPSDVADELATRLVVLGPESPWRRSNGELSPALQFATKILESRGSAPRRYRNTLVFLAPDEMRLKELLGHIARYLAWSSIITDKEELDLSPGRVRQCEEQRRQASDRVDAQISETFRRIMIPYQSQPSDPTSFRELEFKAGTNEGLIEKIVARLKREDAIAPALGSTVLRAKLDEIPLWRDGKIEISQLIEYYASYLYLQRVMDPSVILRTIESGVAQLMWQDETFAYVESYDEVKGRYVGLKAGESISLTQEDHGMIVRPDLVPPQIESKRESALVIAPQHEQTPSTAVPAQTPRKPRRYHARVELDSLRSTEVSRIYNEVISHLTGSISRGGHVKVYLEIEATDEEGFDDGIRRIISENGATLKFQSQGFEEM
jgi:hypothetical protein